MVVVINDFGEEDNVFEIAEEEETRPALDSSKNLTCQTRELENIQILKYFFFFFLGKGLVGPCKRRNRGKSTGWVRLVKV